MKILVIDDEKINRDIIADYLEEEGYEVINAGDGQEGWEKLGCNPDISVILLDRMMPRMDGMDFLKLLKAENQFSHIPVIMQTAAADQDSIVQGIDAGAYYYLTKPYKRRILVSLVSAAASDVRRISYLSDEVKKNRATMGFLKTAHFEIRTVSEAQDLAFFVANAFPEPSRVILGLSELLLNAVEHGNLGISYEEKSNFVQSGTLPTEIYRRENSEENAGKKVVVTLERDAEFTRVNIKDCGNGFDWKPFMAMEPSRATAPNGRGIMMAKMISFDEISYVGTGNEVSCSVRTPPSVG